VCRYSDLVHRLFSLMRVFRLSASRNGVVGGGCWFLAVLSWRAEGVCDTESRAPKLALLAGWRRALTHTHRRRRSLRSQLVLSQWEKRAICFLRAPVQIQFACPNACVCVCESVAAATVAPRYVIRPFPPLFALFAPAVVPGRMVFSGRDEFQTQIRPPRNRTPLFLTWLYSSCTRHKIFRVGISGVKHGPWGVKRESVGRFF
jgi:hypothetical protein